MTEVTLSAVDAIIGKIPRVDAQLLSPEEWTLILDHACTALTPEHVDHYSTLQSILKGDERLHGDPREDAVRYFVRPQSLKQWGNFSGIFCGILTPRPLWENWPRREVPINGQLVMTNQRVTEEMLIVAMNRKDLLEDPQRKNVGFMILSVRWTLHEHWGPGSTRSSRELIAGSIKLTSVSLESIAEKYSHRFPQLGYNILYKLLFAQEAAERWAFTQHKYIAERAKALKRYIQQLS
jgi:hypothetical protein